MKKKIISEVTILCDPPCVPYYIVEKGQEAIADYYESWIRKFDEFIRDHRSQEPVLLSVKREYQYICSHCGREWEEDDNGFPLCCNRAQEEYEVQNTKEANLQHTTAKGCH